MPTFILHTNTDALDEGKSDLIHKEACRILATEIGKSKDFVMTSLRFDANLKFGNSDTNCAFAEVKNVGNLSADCTASISLSLSQLLEKELVIPPERFYIEFQESERRLWGWSGKTFG